MRFFTNRNNDDQYVEVDNNNLDLFLSEATSGDGTGAHKYANASDNASSDAVDRLVDAVKSEKKRWF